MILNQNQMLTSIITKRRKTILEGQSYAYVDQTEVAIFYHDNIIVY